jgi:plasmid stabilization system protein ParE
VNEYVEATARYAEDSETAALRFEAAVENALQAIVAAPEAFPEWDARHRHLILTRFPYYIVYREEGDTIHVVAIAHGRQRPNYWRHRT